MNELFESNYFQEKCMTQSSPCIEIKNLTKSYNLGYEKLDILTNVDFSAKKSEMVLISGPSGAGKTTFLSMLAGLDTDFSGSIMLENQDMKALKLNTRTQLRSGTIGVVYQDYRLLSQLTAFENVEAPLHTKPYKKSQRQQMTIDALSLVNLLNREKHRPHQLSGGEKQRVGIARALVGGANILLCDEPTGNLNKEMSLKIFDLLRYLCAEHGKTVLLSSHDPMAKNYADRIINLENGSFLEAL